MSAEEFRSSESAPSRIKSSMGSLLRHHPKPVMLAILLTVFLLQDLFRKPYVNPNLERDQAALRAIEEEHLVEMARKSYDRFRYPAKTLDDISPQLAREIFSRAKDIDFTCVESPFYTERVELLRKALLEAFGIHENRHQAELVPENRRGKFGQEGVIIRFTEADRPFEVRYALMKPDGNRKDISDEFEEVEMIARR